MAINKLPEFAKDGQKNTDDLVLTDGFPALKKPARQWFNWLFNTLTSKVNEIIDADFIPKADIVNNLTTDDAKKPVSAKQAKNLQDNKLDKTANAVSSSKLETVRTVSFSGAATGSFSYDGSSNSSAILTLANSGVTANTYGASLKIPIITVNAKGLITGVSEQNIPIVDNLTTNDASKPLSAAQGKILNDQKLNKDENAVGIKPINNRILKPSEISLGVQAYFATLNSDNSAFFCDFLSLNGWNDATGGLKNALVLSKTGQSLHHYQAEYASQTWTIKKQIAYIDDNVASASKLKTPRNIFGQNFDGTNDVNGTVTASTGIFQADEYHYIDTGRNGIDRMNFHVYSGVFNFINTLNGNIIARIDQNGIDCNAATATKLQTARTINGVSFDGSANITIQDNTKALLTDFTNSKTENGYQKLANGLILQWGTTSLIASSGGTLIQSETYPITFPTAVLHIFATYRESTGSNADSIYTKDRTNTGFNIGQTSGEAHTVSWFAIGY